MARQKKEKKKAENIEPGPEAVAFTPEVVEPAKRIEVVPVEIAQCDTWRYHEIEQPKMFKQGQQIPAGWTRGNRKFWQVTASGVMERVNG